MKNLSGKYHFVKGNHMFTGEIRIFTFLLILVSFFSSCDENPTKVKKANPLQVSLKSIQGKGILFGHQDDLAYGKNWKYIDGESDVKGVSGDYPAVFGWELGGLERGDQLNLDSVPFEEMKRLIIKADKMGGINTLSWHPYSLVNGGNSWDTDLEVVKHIIPSGKLHNEFIEQLDKIADFLLQFNNEQQEPIPFIFRPWHEMGGSWFWWGSSLTSPEEYKQLFRFTIQYLRDVRGVQNMLVCYSPNGEYQNTDEYLTWYPGDDLVDMLAVDVYEWKKSDDWVENTQKSLDILIQLAKEKDKLSAFAETGRENVPDSIWFTEKLGKVLAPQNISDHLSYVLVWRNDPNVHHFFSYPGHSSEENAKTFLAQPNIWLLNDYNINK